MLVADVEFSWKKSVSNDVGAVSFSLSKSDGLTIELKDLDRNVESYQVVGLEEGHYVVSVTATDGVNESSTSLDFVLDFTAPQPVTNLGFKVLKVYELVQQ